MVEGVYQEIQLRQSRSLEATRVAIVQSWLPRRR